MGAESDKIEGIYDLLQRLNSLEGYVFRGQRCSTWHLVPSYCREKGKKRIQEVDKGIGMNVLSISNYSMDIISEDDIHKMSHLFFFLCNEQGLQLPSTNYHVAITNKMLFTQDFSFIEGKGGCTRDYTRLFSLMQHYGFCTPLLDWSFDPLIAIYFATIDAIRYIVKEYEQLIHYKDEFEIDDDKIDNYMKKLFSSSLSIWALKKNNSKINKDMIIILPEYRGNENLCAQKGIFTLVTSNGPEDSSNRSILNIDELIEKLVNPLNPECELIQYNVGYCYLQELFQYLYRNNVNANRLFPGYIGAVKTIEELGLYVAYTDLEIKYSQ